MRPVGAVIFGMLADRYGRPRSADGQCRFLLSNRTSLRICAELLNLFCCCECCTASAWEAEWGVGASLAMGKRPEAPSWRALWHSAKRVLNGVSAGGGGGAIVLPNLGWRAMFWVGGLPALLALYIRFNVKESEAWKQHRVPTMGAVVKTAIFVLESVQLPRAPNDADGISLAWKRKISILTF